MVNITINEKNIQVPEGTTVLRAAQSAGIEIPTLCDHPELTPYGGCRLCVVEIEGARTLQTSCTLPVYENMVVKTDTEKTQTARKFILDMIFSDRNHFCPFCQVSGGDCELQNEAYNLGMTHWALQPNWQPFEVDASHPYMIIDHNRCILCRRCVRACDELAGNFTLGFEERGAKSILVADLGNPLGESSCISCGACVQVCPTGAIIDRWSAYRGHVEDTQQVKSICTGCSIGCGIDVNFRDNNLIKINGDWDNEINDGVICKVGRFLPITEDRERIVTPLVRKDGKLKAATWDEAINTVAEKMKGLVGKNGSGVAAAASTRLTAESLSAFTDLFKTNAGSDMVTSLEEGKFSTAQSIVAYEGSLEDIKTADCVVLIGEDVVDEHEVAGFFIKRNLPKGIKLIVIDQKENKLSALSDVSLISEKGVLGAVQGITAALAKKSGAAAYAEAAYLISAASKPVFVVGKAVVSEEDMMAVVDLAQVAKAEKSLVYLKGGANSVVANQLGLTSKFDVKGQQAVFLALADEVPSQTLAKTVEKAPFLVVQASYVSQLSAQADVVLPVEMWAETNGHYINLEGKTQKSTGSLTAPVDVKSNEDVLVALGEKLGFKLDTNNWK
ncbi:MAG: molybdopterin-dependent oxidoreductase [Anaerolineaceae bacterium]|nr:molybdopterin-dependent oxidoreductase [Anaerolineaceae bacterium]